jgi:hypothetical protein
MNLDREQHSVDILVVQAGDAAKREALNRRLRQAFYQGAEEEAPGRGRPLDAARLERVFRRYPGDM